MSPPEVKAWSQLEEAPAYIALAVSKELLKRYQIVRLKESTLTIRGNLEDYGSVND